MRNHLFAILVILISFFSCSQPDNSTNDDSDIPTLSPELPSPSGSNSFANSNFIVVDKNLEVIEYIEFSESDYEVWEYDDGYWTSLRKGKYSYNTGNSIIYKCDTDVYDVNSNLIAILDYFGKELDYSTDNVKKFALMLGMSIDSTKDDIINELASELAEPLFFNYSIGSVLTVDGRTGKQLQLTGVYDNARPWYSQKNGAFFGDTEDSSESEIEDCYICWGGARIEYYGDDTEYFLRNISLGTMYFMNILGVQKQNDYEKNGSGEYTNITVVDDEEGFIDLMWEAEEYF